MKWGDRWWYSKLIEQYLHIGRTYLMKAVVTRGNQLMEVWLSARSLG